MRFTDMVQALRGSVVDSLADFDREVALAAGLDPRRVREWEAVHRTYFGRTKWTKWQRKALDKARTSELSIDQLAFIESRLSLIDDPSTSWQTRLSLLNFRGSFDALKRRAKKLVPDPEPAPPKNAVKFGRSRMGKRSMTVTADERLLADTEHFLRDGIDSSKPAMPQMASRLENLLRGNLGDNFGGNPDGAPAPATGVPHSHPRPLVLVGVPDFVSIVRGDGDEVVLGLTDGTTMTGAEFLNRFIATADNELEAALFHPQQGAVNLYRTSRFANQKQRDLARAAMPTCSQPFCRHGADACEIHHITPWSRGGETNVANLAPLCSYHNRVNDDDPRRRQRGRIEMRQGTPIWVSPRGTPVPQMHHSYGAMVTLFGSDPPPGHD
ncbi:HNH endonuclease [Corynebacterium appendicis]|uniref:HNH endonuclease signature motif containing protein n=2 Tax=Corynebacterium appendicis TaxID=163202 RepID=UPI00223BC16E|nr:HNH endonuclease signature motif containing protein [Corynebacterium appendicis]MCT1683309.1 HNH endonuclease [Corynebacterium appendicis]